MKALQRDAATLDVTSNNEVCEQTKDQLKKIVQVHGGTLYNSVTLSFPMVRVSWYSRNKQVVSF